MEQALQIPVTVKKGHPSSGRLMFKGNPSKEKHQQGVPDSGQIHTSVFSIMGRPIAPGHVFRILILT